jgi:predicted metal-dependent hydrolase
MAFDQTKDVLEHVRKFHRKLSVFYEDLKNPAGKERANTLLDYMSRHEKYLETCLAEYQEQVSDNVLDTYFKYGSESTELTAIADFEIKPDMDVDDVVSVAMHFDASLVAFYREMAQRSLSTKVREVFENLLEMEQQEQIELSKQTLGIESL